MMDAVLSDFYYDDNSSTECTLGVAYYTIDIYVFRAATSYSKSRLLN